MGRGLGIDDVLSLSPLSSATDSHGGLPSSGLSKSFSQLCRISNCVSSTPPPLFTACFRRNPFAIVPGSNASISVALEYVGTYRRT